MEPSVQISNMKLIQCRNGYQKENVVTNGNILHKDEGIIRNSSQNKCDTDDKPHQKIQSICGTNHLKWCPTDNLASAALIQQCPDAHKAVIIYQQALM